MLSLLRELLVLITNLQSRLSELCAPSSYQRQTSSPSSKVYLRLRKQESKRVARQVQIPSMCLQDAAKMASRKLELITSSR